MAILNLLNLYNEMSTEEVLEKLPENVKPKSHDPYNVVLTQLHKMKRQGIVELLDNGQWRIIRREKDEEKVEIPEDLFSIIVGYEDIKELFLRSLTSKKPTHILLWGATGTAKTIFMQELSRLNRSRYALGGSSTKAGIARFLIDNRPLFLLIDEIDKMDSADYSVLLSLMETGIVSELKTGRTEEVKLNTRVYAACNNIESIPEEIISRFIVFRIKKYSADDFKKVTFRVLTERENVSAKIAKYIADKLVRKTRDIRCAVHVSRLITEESKKEVDRILETFEKYNSFII